MFKKCRRGTFELSVPTDWIDVVLKQRLGNRKQGVSHFTVMRENETDEEIQDSNSVSVSLCVWLPMRQ